MRIETVIDKTGHYRLKIDGKIYHDDDEVRTLVNELRNNAELIIDHLISCGLSNMAVDLPKDKQP